MINSDITLMSKNILYKYHWEYRNKKPEDNYTLPEDVKNKTKKKLNKNVKEYQGIIPYLTLNNIQGIYDRVLEEDEDGVIFVVAPPGYGKTTVALILAKYIDPTLENETERVIFNIDELKLFLKACAMELKKEKSCSVNGVEYHSKLKGKAVVLDEGVFMMFSGDAMSREGKLIQKLFSVIRALNIMFFVNVTNFRKVNKGVKEDRIIGLIKVIKRGTISFFSKKRVRKIRILENNMIWPRSNFTELIGKLDKTSIYWRNYELRKAEFLYSSVDVDEKPNKKGRPKENKFIIEEEQNGA